MDLGSGRRGVDMGPSALRIAGVASALAAHGHRVVDGGDLDIKNMEEIPIGSRRARYLGEIARASGLLSRAIEKILERKRFPAVLGGTTRSPSGRFPASRLTAGSTRSGWGSLWVDAHSDIHVPKTSPSGNIHGMPLAALFGSGSQGTDRGRWRRAETRPHASGAGRHPEPGGRRAAAPARPGHPGVHDVRDRPRRHPHGDEDALARVTDGTACLHLSFDLDAVDPRWRRASARRSRAASTTARRTWSWSPSPRRSG